jgi:alpha-tubulin suppressor-like RCC1 family protein
VLLRTDGIAVAFGWNEIGECNIPDLPEGVKYWQVSAGALHTLLLRSDGQVVACGKATLCNIPELPEGIKYVQVAAGAGCSILLRSDGAVAGCYDSYGAGEALLPVANVITRSQGPLDLCHNQANMSFDCNNLGQCSFVYWPGMVRYSEVSAGRLHTVLLQTDGVAVACGSNEYGQCNIPPLEDGTRYLQVSAGADYTVLLRSDNRIVTCGRNDMGQCDTPDVEDGYSYLGHTIMLTVLQLFCANLSDGLLCLTCLRLTGEVTCTLVLPGDTCTVSVPGKIAKKTGIAQASLRLALPSAILLHLLSPSTKLKDLLETQQG